MSAERAGKAPDRFAAWRAGKAEREARYAALQLEENARAKAEGRVPLPARGRARIMEIARRRRKKILDAILAGRHKADIAAEEGISYRRLGQILQRAGLDLPQHQGCRWMPISIHGAKAAWLDRFAEKAGITPSEVAARLLTVVLEEPVKAKRMQGKR